jgi:glutathione-specific gamma-glutamylcyclotransferase
VVDLSDKQNWGGSPCREEILSGAFEERAAQFIRDANIPIRPIEERLAIKDRLLDELRADEDVWVYGYGSLIWNPAFHFAERRIARLHGYHRRFVFWSTSGRGSPDCPGMMLALEPGGCCSGVAYRIGRDAVDSELKSVFLRELMTGSYIPRLVRLGTERGPVRAIAFTANRKHPSYAGRMPLPTVAGHMTEAEGGLGTCREYLFNTAEHLHELGIRDSGVETLTRMVRALRGE